MNNDDKNNFNKRHRNIQDSIINKKPKSIIILDDELDNLLTEPENIVEKEFIKIEKKINNITDLI
jgi:hypothetical protein